MISKEYMKEFNRLTAAREELRKQIEKLYTKVSNNRIQTWSVDEYFAQTKAVLIAELFMLAEQGIFLGDEFRSDKFEK